MEILRTTDITKVRETAKTYAKVFAGPEWNEVSRCPIKDRFYGSNYPPGSPGPCKNCNNIVLEEAYPLEPTSKYILREISSKRAVAYTYNDGDRVLAFGWGFELSGSEFADKKYNFTNRGLIKSLVGKRTNYFYVSEIGVVPELQGKGIGGQITRLVAEKGSEIGLPLLLRTIKTSSMAFTAANMDMELIMGGSLPINLEYLIKDKNLPVDPENSERLLFIKK